MNRRKIEWAFMFIKIVLYEYMISGDVKRMKILKSVDKAINVLTIEIYKL